MSYHSVDTSQTPTVVLGQILKTNVLEEVLLPTLLAAINTDWHVSLLAHGRAEAACVLAGSHLCQGITQVVEVALGEQLWRHVVL